MAAVSPTPLLASVVTTGGTAVVVGRGPLTNGGFIQNPPTASEALTVSMLGPNTPTCSLAPGQSYTIPPLNGNVTIWVNAATAGHAFTGELW